MANIDLIQDLQFQPFPKRKLSVDVCRKYGYGLGKDSKGKVCQVAPYYSPEGQVVAQKLRYANKDFKFVGDTKTTMFFGQQLFKEGGKNLYITEGEIDALSLYQAMKWATVSIPNGAQGALKSCKANLEYLESFNFVTFCFDNDKHGLKASKQCAELLTPGKAKIATFPEGFKDANDMLVAGKLKELIEVVAWQSKVFRPDGIINGADLAEKVLEIPQMGYPIQYPELNGKLRGLHKGMLAMFTAGSGIGKSTLVHEIGYELMAQGLKLGIISLEESVQRAAWRYMSIALNKPIHLLRNELTDEQLTQAFDTTLGQGNIFFYDHFGSTSLDNLMNKFKYMATGLDVDFIILDHISIVVSGLDDDGDERKLIDKLMTKIRSLAEETGVGILAIVHLKRKDKGRSYNDGAQVSLSDLRGSGALEQLSDFVIAMERDQQGEQPNLATLRVLKNRHTGVLGVADTLSYSVDTGRLILAPEQTETTEDF